MGNPQPYEGDLVLILHALDDAAFFRASRASAMERVARKGRLELPMRPLARRTSRRLPTTTLFRGSSASSLRQNEACPKATRSGAPPPRCARPSLANA